MNEIVIKEIKMNYEKMEKSIVEELFITVNNHHLTAGTFREKVWKELFESIIPKKFTIEQGAFLIDTKGNVSNETDLVIFDEQYIPYVLKNKNIKFIPIEAVLLVVQCKSTVMKSNDIKKWEKSIDKLKTNGSGIAGTATPAVLMANGIREIKPLKVICGLFDKNVKIENYTSDIIIYAESTKIENGKESKNKKLTIINRHKT